MKNFIQSHERKTDYSKFNIAENISRKIFAVSTLSEFLKNKCTYIAYTFDNKKYHSKSNFITFT